MDSLFAKADAIHPLSKKKTTKFDRKQTKKTDTRKNASAKAGPSTDRTVVSVTQNTSLPRSLRPSSPPPENAPKHAHIKDLKLRTQLNRQAAHAARTKTLLEDAALLLTGDAGVVRAEGDMEKTWRVSQDEIVRRAGQEAATGRQEWRLDGGPYRSRYSRNGRCVGARWCRSDLTTSKKKTLGDCRERGARSHVRLANGHDACGTAVAGDVSGHHVR